MRKPKHYSVTEVLNFSEIGLIFEFYSTKETNFIINDLSRLTSKKVILTGEQYTPSYFNAILLKEYDAKRARYQFHIAPQDYHSIIPIIDSVSSWISESCETTNDTLLKMSLSFNHRNLETLSRISSMKPSRLILKFDENEVYKRFPTQKNSPYAISIKSLVPSRTYINESEVEHHISELLNNPFAEFYGINFKNYTNGVLECNFVGGKGYASKNKEIKDVLEYFIIKTYQSINEEDFSEFERYEIKRLTQGFDKLQMAFYDPEIFMAEFKNLGVYVDLKTSAQTLKTYWSTIRQPLFEMIINGGLREGQFNYDTEIGKFQLRKGKLNGTMIRNMDLVLCEISGVLDNCSFVGCKINKARIYNSKIINGNKINESYLKGVSVNKPNEISKSVIENNEEMVNCPVSESLIKYATPGKDLKVDENSTVVVKRLPLPEKTDAIEIEKIRDYTFIKDMNKSGDKGFQNAYNKNTYLK